MAGVEPAIYDLGGHRFSVEPHGQRGNWAVVTLE